MNIALLVSEFNYEITSMMAQRARQHVQFLGHEVAEEVLVPGVYDMPLALRRLLARNEIDGAVALGAVIEGETEHDEVVIQQAARKLADLAVEYDKPVGFGLTGPGMSRLQAEKRIERAKAAVEACVKMAAAGKPS